ncbi:MAG: DUF1848 domain-containing protein [Deltaproteobacteria bacterium]|nr:DUF1848 domain-containing protein [Deltaproteobacteria bacterium]
MRIVSVSRRTDIPAFYGKWFMNRVQAGFVLVENPFSGKLYAVSLRPDDVAGFVFWSKNFKPFLPVLPVLKDRGYGFYFHYTITGLPRLFEPSVPPAEETLESFSALADRTSSEHVFWRYDPIVVSDVSDRIYHIERFQTLARALEGKTRRCYVSFPTLYAKVRRRFDALLQKENIRVVDPSPEAKRELIGTLAEIATNSGITLYSCCDENLVGGNVRKARCVDSDTMNRLFPNRAADAKRNPSRKGCGCSDSKDIGAYDSCPHGCIYCYANARREFAGNVFRTHDAANELLSAGNKSDYEKRKKEALQAIGW